MRTGTQTIEIKFRKQNRVGNVHQNRAGPGIIGTGVWVGAYGGCDSDCDVQMAELDCDWTLDGWIAE